MTATNIGARVIQARQRREMTQQDLAVAAGITVTTVSRLETGRNAATLDVIMRLGEALGVDWASLVDGR